MVQQNLFGSTIVTLAHHYLTRLHWLTADICSAIAADRLGGLEGLYTFHPGAGFGADMRVAQLYGASKILGVEISSEQVSLYDLLESAPEVHLRRAIVGDPVASLLYPKESLVAVAEAFLEERRTLKYLGSVKPTERKLVNGDMLQWQTWFDPIKSDRCGALIGNIMLHWAVDSQGSVQRAINTWSVLLGPGSVAVFRNCLKSPF